MSQFKILILHLSKNWLRKITKTEERKGGIRLGSWKLSVQKSTLRRCSSSRLYPGDGTVHPPISMVCAVTFVRCVKSSRTLRLIQWQFPTFRRIAAPSFSVQGRFPLGIQTLRYSETSTIIHQLTERIIQEDLNLRKHSFENFGFR
jgi:hypothetical protein